MQKIKKICALAKITVSKNIYYSKSLWINIFSTCISIMIYYFLWSFVFQKTANLEGFSKSDMGTYILLSRILSSQFSDGIDMEFGEWVSTGNIIVELLRPIGIKLNLFSRRLGQSIFFLLFKAIPITVIGTFILNASKPYNTISLLLFGIVFFLSTIIIFYIEFIIGLISFYTLTTHSLHFTKVAILSVLSGGVIPISFFPNIVQKILNISPFSGLIFNPINIYLGNYSRQKTITSILVQFFWILILLLLSNYLFKRVSKKIVIQGG